MEYTDKTRLMQRIHTGMTLIEAMQEIIDAPAADVVEVRHGRWERTEGNPYPACSECGCESLSRADRPYCQFCGAVMDGGEDNG